MGTKVIERILERPLEVFKQAGFCARFVFVGHQGFQNLPITGFFDIRRAAQYQPRWVII